MPSIFRATRDVRSRSRTAEDKKAAGGSRRRGQRSRHLCREKYLAPNPSTNATCAESCLLATHHYEKTDSLNPAHRGLRHGSRLLYHGDPGTGRHHHDDDSYRERRGSHPDQHEHDSDSSKLRRLLSRNQIPSEKREARTVSLFSLPSLSRLGHLAFSFFDFLTNDGRNRLELFAALQIHQLHSLRVTTGLANLRNARSHHLAFGCN